MMMPTVQQRLTEFLLPRAQRCAISDVRIGLGYTAVRLDTGQAGVAWTPKSSPAGCTHLSGAGNLAGRPAEQMLSMLADKHSALARAVGLATANALLVDSRPTPVIRDEIISTLEVTADDQVAMVGYFGPIVGRLQKTGCRLDIVEIDAQQDTHTLSPQQGRAALAACTIAIITGTTLINGTFEEVCADLKGPRAAVLLGPSAPLCADVFSGTGITHVAGSRVLDADAILRIVSEGGGTMLMKRHLSFETILTDAP
jgi:uncharacterized protein (DUF4213/DUF364 family)